MLPLRRIYHGARADSFSFCDSRLRLFCATVYAGTFPGAAFPACHVIACCAPCRSIPMPMTCTCRRAELEGQSANAVDAMDKYADTTSSLMLGLLVSRMVIGGVGGGDQAGIKPSCQGMPCHVMLPKCP